MPEAAITSHYLHEGMTLAPSLRTGRQEAERSFFFFFFLRCRILPSPLRLENRLTTLISEAIIPRWKKNINQSLDQLTDQLDKLTCFLVQLGDLDQDFPHPSASPISVLLLLQVQPGARAATRERD